MLNKKLYTLIITSILILTSCNNSLTTSTSSEDSRTSDSIDSEDNSSIQNTSQSSSNIDSSISKIFGVNYNGTIELLGEKTIIENEDYHFTFDYDDSYKNEALEVKVNGHVINKTNDEYIVNNVNQDLNIETNLVKKEKYQITLTKDDKIYDIFTEETNNFIEPNGNYIFTLRFWGDIDLSKTKVFASNTLIEPSNYTGNYSQDTFYNFELTSINQDVIINIIDANPLTYYTYKLNDKTLFSHTVYADENIDTDRFGYNFLGWSLKENDKSSIVTLPYKNDTEKNEVTLYAIYEFDNRKLDLPYIKVNTSSPLEKEEYSKVEISLNNKEYKTKLPAKMRIRGNSTSNYFKKPYRIKFNEDTSIFGSPKYKNWVLLAEYLDPSLMRNYTALTLSNYSNNMDFKHFLKHVELEINGVYQGVYLLTDQIEASKKGRCEIKVDVLNEEEVPFLLERDKDGEGIEGVDYFSLGLTNYIIKYPKKPTTKQFNYIYNYIKNLYEAIINKDLNVVIKNLDMPSFYDYVLINELMVNIDSNWKSGYMYKNLDGPLSFGPIWDFDWCFSTWTSSPCVEQDFKLEDKFFLLKRDPKDFSFDWMIYLIQSEDIFIELINSLNKLKTTYQNTLRDIKKYFPLIKEAGLRNYNLWYAKDYKQGGKKNYIPKHDNLFYDQYEFIVRSLEQRYNKLDSILKPSNHKEFINVEFQ